MNQQVIMKRQFYCAAAVKTHSPSAGVQVLRQHILNWGLIFWTSFLVVMLRLCSIKFISEIWEHGDIATMR